MTLQFHQKAQQTENKRLSSLLPSILTVVKGLPFIPADLGSGAAHSCNRINSLIGRILDQHRAWHSADLGLWITSRRSSIERRTPLRERSGWPHAGVFCTLSDRNLTKEDIRKIMKGLFRTIRSDCHTPRVFSHHVTPGNPPTARIICTGALCGDTGRDRSPVNCQLAEIFIT